MTDTETLKINSAAGESWDAEADVLIIGFGAAGASAAIEAADNGASVLVIDSFGGGGATAYSGGVIYAGVTDQQREAGFEDSLDDMARYLQMEVGDAASPDLIRQYCAESSTIIRWLESLGLRFGSSLAPDPKTPGPPLLLFGGNERAAPYNATARPAPRGHRVAGPGLTGPVLFEKLKAAALARGAQLMTHCIARQLISDSAGRIVGVEAIAIPEQYVAAHQALFDKIRPLVPFQEMKAERIIAKAHDLERRVGRRMRLHGRKGVILCTGGFTYNLQMLKQYAPDIGNNLKAFGRSASIGDDGSAIRLGLSAGARTSFLDKLNISKALSPPAAFLQGILVNAKAQRFIGETSYLSTLGVAIASQPGGRAWLILPRADWRNAYRQVFKEGWAQFKTMGVASLLNMLFGGTRKAASFRQLARKCGLDAAAFLKTIDHYNTLARSGSDDDFSKSSAQLRVLGDGPCAAINMSATNRFGFMQVFTLGGLKVDESSGAVIGGNDKAIPGLYAAGRAASGLPSNGYISGLSLGDCIFSGRRAAKAIAHDPESAG